MSNQTMTRDQVGNLLDLIASHHGRKIAEGAIDEWYREATERSWDEQIAREFVERYYGQPGGPIVLSDGSLRPVLPGDIHVEHAYLRQPRIEELI